MWRRWRQCLRQEWLQTVHRKRHEPPDVCGNVCGDTVSTSFFVLPWPGSQRGKGNIKTLNGEKRTSHSYIKINIKRKMRNSKFRNIIPWWNFCFIFYNEKQDIETRIFKKCWFFWIKTDNKDDPIRGWNDEMGGVFCGEKAENRPNQLINDVRESTLSAGVFEFYFVLLPASWDLTALWARCTGVDSDLTMNAGWVFEIDKILIRKFILWILRQKTFQRMKH